MFSYVGVGQDVKKFKGSSLQEGLGNTGFEWQYRDDTETKQDCWNSKWVKYLWCTSEFLFFSDCSIRSDMKKNETRAKHVTNGVNSNRC